MNLKYVLAAIAIGVISAFISEDHKGKPRYVWGGIIVASICYLYFLMYYTIKSQSQ